MTVLAHEEVVEALLDALRDSDRVWSGDAHALACYLRRFLEATGNDAYSAALAEAIWRHFEEVNPL